MLTRNLAAIRAVDPDLADAIAAAEPEPVDLAVGPRGLTSGHGCEADTAGDLTASGVVAVAGFGLGFHIRDHIARTRGSCVTLVYEPRLGLLRGVLERVDHSGWLPLACIVTEPEHPRLSAMLHRHMGLTVLGARFVPHWAVEGSRAFFECVASGMESARTMVHTNIVLSERTLANQIANLSRYAASPGVGDLRDAAKGVPAIVVSAGPSLDDALPWLARPWVRERFVIVATPPTLRALLAAGVRPHLVCALDYHDISAQFYRGLTAADVEGVELVLESKVSPAVPAAWPGAVRFVGDGASDDLLGTAEPAGDHLRPGSSVAHLCHGLARHLGCDPVVLVGQDLCYTRGCYYADCVARQAWADRLAEGADLAQLQAERMARIGPSLRECRDEATGGVVMSDVQLLTYLDQFEREFEGDRLAGLTVIDAGGGMVKRGAERMPLREVLAKWAETGAVATCPNSAHHPDTCVPLRLGRRRPPRSCSDHGRPSRPTPVHSIRSAPPREPGVDVAGRLVDLAERADHLARLCREGLDVLAGMEADPRAMDAGVARLRELGARAATLDPVFGLAQRLNVLGRLTQTRHDRAILLATWTAAEEHRLAQVRRDIPHLTALGAAAEKLAGMLRSSAEN